MFPKIYIPSVSTFVQIVNLHKYSNYKASTLVLRKYRFFWNILLQNTYVKSYIIYRNRFINCGTYDDIFIRNETWKIITTVAHGECCSAPEWQTGLAIVSHTVKQIISCFETIWAVNCRSLSSMPDGLDFQRIVSISECNFEVAP